MSMRQSAIQRILNNELSTADILCAFDIIGNEYLGGEQSYLNHFDGITDLITDFELEPNEIVQYMVDNNNYRTSDLFLTFDGEELTSFSDIEYFKYWVIKKMDGECAEFVLGL